MTGCAIQCDKAREIAHGACPPGSELAYSGRTLGVASPLNALLSNVYDAAMAEKMRDEIARGEFYDNLRDRAVDVCGRECEGRCLNCGRCGTVAGAEAHAPMSGDQVIY